MSTNIDHSADVLSADAGSAANIWSHFALWSPVRGPTVTVLATIWVPTSHDLGTLRPTT